VSIADNNELSKGSVEKSLSNPGTTVSATGQPIVIDDGFEEERKELEAVRARRLADDEARAAQIANIRRETSGHMNINDLDAAMEGADERAVQEVEASRARRLAEGAVRAEAAATIRGTVDIVARAKKLFQALAIDFKDVKQVRKADMFVTQPLMTDENKLVVLNALFGDDGDDYDEMPHHDLFRGRYVDHKRDLIDDHYSVVRWIEAFSAADLKGVPAKGAREILKEWAKHHKQNDLVVRLDKVIPEWDGKKRIRTQLIDFFRCDETDLNKDFSEYFWLSLYCRVTNPGSLAPMVMSLFGAQGCGKSRFTKRVCQIITGNLDADSIQLNLSGDTLDFLRNITGASVIASVGEMTGFKQGDLNKIKDFVTRQNDPLHYKFEGQFVQQRQWVTVMDSNKYEGLQRDESGNRRFYPIFCGQLPDANGKPQWDLEFKIPEEQWDKFEGEVWQMMAEARHWITTNTTRAYGDLVRRVEAKVFKFSAEEMRLERGTVEDEKVGPYIDAALRSVDKYQMADAKGGKYIGVRREELFAAIDEIAGWKVSSSSGFGKGLNKAMAARGGGEKTFLPMKVNGKRTTTPGYKFLACDGLVTFYAALDKRMGVNADGDYIEATKLEGF
jgi:hypothetical protein